jgi:hypothetical protein
VAETFDLAGNLITWDCGACGHETTVRHFLQRGGVIVHDPDAALREAAGLDEPEPTPPEANGCDAAG